MSVLLQDKQEHITILTLNRPDRMNAMNRELSQALVEAYLDFREDESAWVLILTGAGDRAFSAGIDLRENDERARAGLPLVEPKRGYILYDIWSHNLEVWKPTIAAINGWCLAGGCELACSCDLRIMEEQAQIGLPEIKRGMGARATTTKMQYIMPFTVGLELLWVGEPLSAQRAYQLGMINRVVPQGQALAESIKLAQSICDNAPITVRFQKEMAYRTLGMPWPYAMAYSTRIDPYQSEDLLEGSRAFAEGRKPIWKGR